MEAVNASRSGAWFVFGHEQLKAANIMAKDVNETGALNAFNLHYDS